MSLDENLWKLGIANQFSTYSTAHVTTGTVTIATATVTIGGAFVDQSGKSGSVYAAYKDLFERLHEGQVSLLAKLTTTQRDALTGVNDGRQILNITTNAVECCNGGEWQNDSGIGVMLPVAFGTMFENNGSGSATNSTSKEWITAAAGQLDGNTLITFSSTATSDRLVIGTGGAGTYEVTFKTNFTNAGGNLTTASILLNGSAQTNLVDVHAGDSSEIRGLSNTSFLVLADADVISLHVVSSTASDVIDLYQTSVVIRRLT